MAKKKKKKTTTRATTLEERHTYLFCRSEVNRYVPRSTKWAAFRSGTVDQLRFHRRPAPAAVRDAEIEIFAERLDTYLLSLGFAGKMGARAMIRGAVTDGTQPMQVLLDVIADNYRK